MAKQGRDLTPWRSQLRKGAAELAVLTCLGQGESYGLALYESLRGDEGLGLSEGAIYALLHRMQKEGMVIGGWVEEADASHPRKYYSLTGDGKRVLDEMIAEWEDFAGSMSTLIARFKRNPVSTETGTAIRSKRV
jgi:PadR family transcriptional regulator, regulatory protein PadR